MEYQAEAKVLITIGTEFEGQEWEEGSKEFSKVKAGLRCRLPTPVLSLRESHGQSAWWATVHGVAKTRLNDFTLKNF